MSISAISNKLEFDISCKSLLKYALPTILSSFFMNIYSLIDSLFVANLVSIEALSAVNIVWPILSVALALSTMISTGGCALVAKQMGEGNYNGAKRNFSFFVLFSLIVSIFFCLIGLLWRKSILRLLGADNTLYSLCEAYAVPLFIMIPFAMVGMVLQPFFVAAGSPGLGFALSLIGGGLNVVLDYVLIHTAQMGISGAAVATGIGYCVQSIVGILYFIFNRRGTLYFSRPKFSLSVLLRACGNGSSEMVSMMAVSITMIAMNIILMNLAGSDGVAAAAVVVSAQTILSAIYMGYQQGISPLISYNFGAGNYDKLQRIHRNAVITIAIMSLLTFVVSILAARPLALIYCSDKPHVLALSVRGIRIFSFSFILMGFNMYASSMFTALNDGKTSAILSFMRTLVFVIIPMLILPQILGVDGVWFSLPAAEVLSVVLTAFYLIKKKNIYHYA